MASYSKDEQKILVEFGDTLRACRLDKDLYQEKLAEITGLHRTYIGSAERGERNVSLLNLNKIAKALGVRISQLV